MDEVKKMSNEEAIKVLGDLIPPVIRANGKSTAHLMTMLAISKAIEALKAEPIVRCGECKYHEKGECHNSRYGDGWANYPPPQVYDEYFCKDGERNDEGVEK